MGAFPARQVVVYARYGIGISRRAGPGQHRAAAGDPLGEDLLQPVDEARLRDRELAIEHTEQSQCLVVELKRQHTIAKRMARDESRPSRGAAVSMQLSLVSLGTFYGWG